MKRKLLGILLALLGSTVPAAAQVTLTYTFTNGTTADADQVNTNFSQVAAAALNRTGGTLTGNILANAGVTVDGVDIGATVCTTCTPTFAGATLTGALAGTAATFSTTLGVTGASTLAALSATTGTFSSTLGVSGALSGSSASFSGTLGVSGASTLAAVSATTGTFSSTLGVTGASTLAALSATTGTFSGALAATTGAFSGAVTVTGGTAGSGTISKHASNGFFLAGATGSSYDFVIANPTGASAIFANPTGTLNAQFFGTVSASGLGTHLFSAGGVGGNTLTVANTTSGAGNYALLRTTAGTTNGSFVSYSQGYTTGTYDVQASTLLQGGGAGGLSIVASDAAGAIRFYTGGTSQRWGINAAGDTTVGASSHIADSVGTPTLSSCLNCGSATIAGTDYAFRITYGTVTNNTAVTVAFGHTWSTTPVCVASGSNFNGSSNISAPDTTGTTLFAQSATVPSSGSVVMVMCRSY